MIQKLLQPDIQKLISEHYKSDPDQLRLAWSKIPDFPVHEVVDQIVSKRKAEGKIPGLMKKSIIYPPPLSMEQCSSETTALYKSSLISGTTSADLTGGAGIDSMFLSKKFADFTYIESDKWLSQIASHNFKIWGAANIRVINTSAESFISSTKKMFDLIYLDPSRRKDGNRVFRFADTQPNVIELVPQLIQITQSLLIKASPLIEIKQAIYDLQKVHKVWIIALKNEVKEVLFQLKNLARPDPEIEAIDLVNDSDSFVFRKSEEESAKPNWKLPEPGDFLYDPNKAIIKSGAFNLLSERYNVSKYGDNTHLYSSRKIISFPGRVFQILQIITGSSKRDLKLKEVDIISKNYSLQASEIQKRFRTRPGNGTQFLIGAGRGKDARLMLCHRRS